MSVPFLNYSKRVCPYQNSIDKLNTYALRLLWFEFRNIIERIQINLKMELGSDALKKLCSVNALLHETNCGNNKKRGNRPVCNELCWKKSTV